MPGVVIKGKPITKNIQSIIKDSRKQSVNPLIVGFVLFPIGLRDTLYVSHLNTIVANTGVTLIEETHYSLVEMEVDDQHQCRALVCTFSALVTNT